MFSIHFYCMAQLACVPPNAEFTLMQTEPEKTKKKIANAFTLNKSIQVIFPVLYFKTYP